MDSIPQNTLGWRLQLASIRLPIILWLRKANTGILKEYRRSWGASSYRASTSLRALAVCQVQWVRVLDWQITVLGWHDITRRDHGGPRKGTRYVRLEATNTCTSSVKFSWVSWLLSKVHSELLQDCKANYRALEEGNQVHLQGRSWWCIPGIKEVVNYITSASIARHRHVIWRILWCF
jgi:hypothetical protein